MTRLSYDEISIILAGSLCVDVGLINWDHAVTRIQVDPVLRPKRHDVQRRISYCSEPRNKKTCFYQLQLFYNDCLISA